MKIMGIDIGTTTISAVVADSKNKEVIQAYTAVSYTHLPGKKHRLPRQESGKSLKCSIIFSFFKLLSHCLESNAYGPDISAGFWYH